MHRHNKLILVLATVATAVMLCVPPFDIAPSYHLFADRRTLFGIPNFMQVISNLPWAVVGVLGLLRARRIEWIVLFAGVLLVSAGSAYYHLAPDQARLLWDRLPMTIVFMSLLAVLLDTPALLAPLVAVGAASVLYWRASGDVRFYGLVQFFPVAAILIVRVPGTMAVLASYAAAKVFEIFDSQVFSMTHVISGHTLKHLTGALAAYFLLSCGADPRPAQ